MANTITSGLQRDKIIEAVMTAFMATLTPLRLFSYAFRNVQLEGTDKMRVPYYPLHGAASKDFEGTYEFGEGTNTLSKEVTINKRKYQPLSFTSAERARQPFLDPEMLGMLRGAKLAEDVLTDILGLVTAANYGDTAFSNGNFDAAHKLVSTYANFDMEDVIDLETIADEHKWPQALRGLVLRPSYTGNLKKDIATAGGLSTFGLDPKGNVETFPMINSFNLAKTTVIPENGEHLQGFAVYPSAILVGFSPVPPAGKVADLVDYEAVEDPETGLVLEFREWADADTDTSKWTVECNYGYAKGEEAALKRIVRE